MATLVVGVDFSSASKKALDAAVVMAQELGASLVMVYATAPLPVGSARGHLDPISKVMGETDAAEVAAMSATWAKDASKAVKPGKVELVVKEGKAADVILAVANARKAAYVVVGSHGRTGLKRVVLGSVAEAVVRNSQIPVVVVPD